MNGSNVNQQISERICGCAGRTKVKPIHPKMLFETIEAANRIHILSVFPFPVAGPFWIPTTNKAMIAEALKIIIEQGADDVVVYYNSHSHYDLFIALNTDDVMRTDLEVIRFDAPW